MREVARAIGNLGRSGIRARKGSDPVIKRQFRKPIGRIDIHFRPVVSVDPPELWRQDMDARIGTVVALFLLVEQAGLTSGGGQKTHDQDE
jgi:hypothetical protein